MKILLGFLFFAAPAVAHDSEFGCNAHCENAPWTVPITTHDRDEQTALDLLREQCSDMGGKLAPAPGGYCHAVWH